MSFISLATGHNDDTDDLYSDVSVRNGQTLESGMSTAIARIDHVESHLNGQSTALQTILSGLNNQMTSDDAARLCVASQHMSLQLAGMQNRLEQLVIASERQQLEGSSVSRHTSGLIQADTRKKPAARCRRRSQKFDMWNG